jgi:hypothetical protein
MNGGGRAEIPAGIVWQLGKTPFDGANGTQTGSLCYGTLVFRTIERSSISRARDQDSSTHLLSVCLFAWFSFSCREQFTTADGRVGGSSDRKVWSTQPSGSLSMAASPTPRRSGSPAARSGLRESRRSLPDDRESIEGRS